MQLSRLHGRKVNERVLRKGNVWKGKAMTIRWFPGHPKHPGAIPGTRAIYAGTVASAKLHKSAVKRNRMRRRCREALRTAVREREDLATVQLLILPRSSSLDCAFPEIQQDIRSFLSVLPHG